MLLAIALILLVLWLLGFIVVPVGGSLIHILPYLFLCSFIFFVVGGLGLALPQGGGNFPKKKRGGGRLGLGRGVGGAKTSLGPVLVRRSTVVWLWILQRRGRPAPRHIASRSP